LYVKSAVCGKGPAHLLRLSAILQSLHDAFNCVTRFAQDKKTVDEEFVQKVEEMLAKGYEPEISVENVKRAHVLLEFFNKNKMVLSGYQHEDWSGDFKEILLSLAKAKPVVTLEQQIIKHILLSENQKINANEVNQKFTAAKADIIKTIFEKLADLKIGKSCYEKNGRGKRSLLFEKREIESALKDVDFIKAIELVGVDITEYSDANKKAERKFFVYEK